MSTDQYQQALRDLHVGFSVKNNGVHLIVEGPQGYIDVWPTTGKWHARNEGVQGFGLRELLLFVTKGETLQVHTFQRTIKLELTETTARWIKGVTQNPLWVSHENEPEEESRARKEIWDALQGIEL